MIDLDQLLAQLDQIKTDIESMPVDRLAVRALQDKVNDLNEALAVQRVLARS